ncbi:MULTISPECIES: carbonic anhydrase [unclassified Streptomyces]|uniref:carbonic anhydrase n=1 Tax=unclassified Streptomyces TaxID=2593676 RepID=UPI0015879478|nr:MULTISPECIES: carbonic anhydrase [unclassified Streptomyces]NUV70979.1 carbonic anhydrase [Streptomyces sp. CAI-121]NUV99200.1 carbonic anhydrase [Streptomyces sp. CAI 127]NUW17146.1 carbonic anhydrase [Streptomyces sp. CAI-68]
MQSLVEHARTFTEHVAANAKDFERLADGQTPEALFVTCSDSRVVPSLITGARPGQLFELRTAGNIVPPYPGQDRPTGEAATIEYALCVLQVRDIIVCGHSHCGAVGAILRGDDLSAMPAVRHWLERSTDGRTPPDDAGDLPGAVQAHALAQLDTLRGYPAVRDRLAEGSLGLHAWYYEVHTGSVSVHRPERGTEFARL